MLIAVLGVLIVVAIVFRPDRNEDPGTSIEALMTDGVGFGESRDFPGGKHAVHDMLDPSLAVKSAGLEPDAGNRIVSALVSQCSGSEEPTRVSDDGWAAFGDNGGKFASDARPLPTLAGSPSVDDGRVIAAGKCAFAEVPFEIPDDVSVKGIFYAHTGATTATWVVPSK